MVKKVFGFAVLAIFLASCTTVSPNQTYRPIGEESQLIISAQSGLGGLLIYINGTEVIKGAHIHDKNLNGTYKDYEVHAICQQKVGLTKTKQWCDVYVDGEFAANLDLSL